jgi:hypothetical protein
MLFQLTISENHGMDDKALLKVWDVPLDLVGKHIPDFEESLVIYSMVRGDG